MRRTAKFSSVRIILDAARGWLFSLKDYLS
jgi:hypothetical protein